MNEDELKAAVEVAGLLHEEYYEAMMETGQAQEFTVLIAPPLPYVAIRLGEAVLWDNEDEREEGDQTPESIQKHCERELARLAWMFQAFMK